MKLRASVCPIRTLFREERDTHSVVPSKTAPDRPISLESPNSSDGPSPFHWRIYHEEKYFWVVIHRKGSNCCVYTGLLQWSRHSKRPSKRTHPTPAQTCSASAPWASFLTVGLIMPFSSLEAAHPPQGRCLLGPGSPSTRLPSCCQPHRTAVRQDPWQTIETSGSAMHRCCQNSGWGALPGKPFLTVGTINRYLSGLKGQRTKLTPVSGFMFLAWSWLWEGTSFSISPYYS